MSKFGEYDSLNKDQSVPLDLQKFADFIVTQNYGFNRMLTALVRAQKKKFHSPIDYNNCFLTKKIEQMLNEGFYR